MNSFYAISSFCNFLLLLTSGISNAAVRQKRAGTGHWGYEEHNGPETWGGLCRTGSKQSPIDIDTSSAVPQKLPQFEFGEQYLSKLEARATNNGHTISVELVNNSNSLFIAGGGLADGKFIFDKLHFHWGSEHLIDGERAVLEMHLVHYNAKYKDINTAASKPDGLAVIGVLFDEHESPNEVVEKFLANAWSDIEELEPSPDTIEPMNDDDTSQSSDEFALRDLLPVDITPWYRYEGSLTTPGCAETVTWTVLANRQTVSKKMLEQLRKLHSNDGTALEKNYRSAQPLNGRSVYVQIDRAAEDVDDDVQQNTALSKSVTPVLPNYLFFGYIFIMYAIH